MAALSNVKWIRGSYNVRQLHPTLRLLMWDYGSLDEYQESEYVNAKITMLPSPIHKVRDVAIMCKMFLDTCMLYQI